MQKCTEMCGDLQKSKKILKQLQKSTEINNMFQTCAKKHSTYAKTFIGCINV